VRSRETGRGTSGTRCRARFSSTTGSLGSSARDGTGAVNTGVLEKTRAARSSGLSDSLLGGSLTLEVAATGDLLGIGVESERELLAAGAHAVDTVGAGSGVLVDTLAVLAILLTADETEHLAEILLLGVVGDLAAESLHHARAEVGVGDRREGVRLGFPLASSDLGACGGSGVAGLVLGHLDTDGSGLGDLLGQVVKVLVGLNLAILDGSETWQLLEAKRYIGNRRDLPNSFSSSKYM
jgi:hypothetical protein